MDNQFSQIDFGPLKQFLDNDDITDISYDNNGQVWLKSLSKGVYRVENTGIDNALMEKIAFQCANSMGKSFNMANPFLDAESAELRMNFVHDSIAKNGIAVLIRKTPAKIRLQKDKIIAEDYIRLNIHDFLLKCVEGHCNIMVSGETGSGKTEFIKYLAAHTKENEKIMHDNNYRTVSEMYIKNEKFKNKIKNSPGDYKISVTNEMYLEEINKVLDNQIKLGLINKEFKDEYLKIYNSRRSYAKGPGGNSPYGGDLIDRMTGKCKFDGK